jgi:hypothetical protein
MLSTTWCPSSLSLECSGGKHTQARCHQTNKARLKEAMEAAKGKWTVVAEHATTSCMATDVPDIADAMYRHA